MVKAKDIVLKKCLELNWNFWRGGGVQTPPKKHPWGKEGINSLLYSRSDTGLVPCNNFILVLYKHQVKIYVVVQIFLCLKIFKPV